MNKKSINETIKENSKGLRGKLADNIKNNITGAIDSDEQQLIKFHGMYMQDDRDVREERENKKLERYFSFMIRLRIPAGVITASQWQEVYRIAQESSTGIIKITTRQTVQLHGMIKSKIKPTIKDFARFNLDSIAACGDVNRNVAASGWSSPIREEVQKYADLLSIKLLPKTLAYNDIWLDGEKLKHNISKDENDPLYKTHYLPRKFKIGIAVPPNNDIDVFTNDIGLIAIYNDNKLLGFNIAIGGGLGTTHGNKETYPKLGEIIGYCDKDDVLNYCYEIITVQRDFGNREQRHLSRLKYTIDKMGLDNFAQEVEKRVGKKLLPVKEFQFNDRIDEFGWKQDPQKKFYKYTILVEHGRLYNNENNIQYFDALNEITNQFSDTEIHFTSNQNLIISNVSEQNKEKIDKILDQYKVKEFTEKSSNIRKNSMACVALNTCSLALAEAQRYMPSLITKIELLMKEHDILNKEIIIRMTGCPNGCARSRNAEIGFVDTALGHYNLYIGGDKNGHRLNFLYKENLNENKILEELNFLFKEFKKSNENFGDFSYNFIKKEN